MPSQKWHWEGEAPTEQDNGVMECWSIGVVRPQVTAHHSITRLPGRHNVTPPPPVPSN